MLSALMIETDLFSYAVHYSIKRRSIALQIKQGQLTVRAPSGVSLPDIQALVRKKHNWILKHMRQAEQHVKPDWLAQQEVPLQGTLLTLQLQSASQSLVILDDDRVIVNISTRVQALRHNIKVRELLQQWYKKQALQWFTQRLNYWQNQMNLHAKELVIGNWQSKWGYCKQSGEIGFNWRLMMAPSWIADYVIVHELAHLKHLNHSANFWRLVQQYYMDIDVAQSWLKQHQHWMEL